MARLNIQTASSDVESDPESSSTRRSRRVTSDTTRSSAISYSSDKENQDKSTGAAPRGGKRNPNVRNMASSSTSASGSSNKKRKLADRGHVLPSQAVHRRELDERVDKQFYDPDQDEEERRATRKSMRDLNKELNDSRAEYLQADSKGLIKTLKKADTLFKNVKQTSDATIDSRLLVTAADLSYKKTNEMALGDSSTGVDVDEFVSKCIAFMKKGTELTDRGDGSSFAGPSSTQTQRRRRHHGMQDEDEDDEQLDWAYLGRKTCFLHNSRPCLSGFLLGPLSVQKRVRQQTQRRAREARANPANATRPLAILAEDVEKLETANLTVVCSEIRELLQRIQTKGEDAVNVAYSTDENMPDEAVQDLMRQYGLADDGCVPLFDFCVNPKSFGQTVENMFYVSFLIKEGSVGLSFDGRGLPTLGRAGTKTVAQRQEAPKYQAIFTLDFEMWEDIIESHGIEKSLIPNRREEEYDDGTTGRAEGGGWYD